MRLSTVEIDEFILDAERTKNERITRRQIREILLAHLTKHHERYELPVSDYILRCFGCLRCVGLVLCVFYCRLTQRHVLKYIW